VASAALELRPTMVDLIAPSNRVLLDTKAALSDTLCSGAAEIVRLLGVSNYLACITVAEHERAAGRLLVGDEAAARLPLLCHELGASCLRAPFRMRSTASPVEGTDHCAQFVADSVADGRVIFHIGITPAFAEGAQLAETSGDHPAIGRLFGYPDCCVRHFAAGPRTSLDRLPASIPSTGPLPFEMNPVTPYLYGVNFLFHFACSAWCEASLSLLRARRSFLSRFAPPAAAFATLGRGIALYGPAIGIGLVTAFDHIGPDRYRVREVVTASPTTASLFAGVGDPVLHLFSPHSFSLGGRHFDDDRQFAALFA
jgi:hypothetical protein